MRRDVFQAIADPTRRAIIGMVAQQSQNLNTIAENFDVSRPAISQHIKILTECGLIVIKKQGRERYCEVRAEPLEEVSDWVEPFRRLWATRFDKLDILLEDMKSQKSNSKNQKTNPKVQSPKSKNQITKLKENKIQISKIKKQVPKPKENKIQINKKIKPTNNI